MEQLWYSNFCQIFAFKNIIENGQITLLFSF
jgi:hypothetical protein